MSTNFEAAVLRSVRWVIPGAVVGGLGLFLPQATDPARLTVVTVHLSLVVAFGMVVAWDLERLPREDWFTTLPSHFARNLASSVSVVSLVTGAVALVTLASSAALRLDPSLQFLQLLSALDITWVVTGVVVGVRAIWSRNVAWVIGISVAGICVWSIWRYLAEVGFTPEGGWQVDADALVRFVLPFDVVAASMAIGALVVGARRGVRVEAR